MPSLKEILKQTIQEQGTVTTYLIEDVARMNQYKISNAERRLRELANEGAIKTRRNEKGIIIGYERIRN